MSPSLLSADLANAASETSRLENAGITWLHLDVMDGEFVPNITFGAPFIKSLRAASNLFFDVHLMVEDPGRYLEDFAKAGANLLVIHLEASRHPQRCLEQIRALHRKAGMALNPGTDFSRLRWLLPDLDMILLMGVNPGFSGQKYIPQTGDKVAECRKYLDSLGYASVPIQVDGGVSPSNSGELVEKGASILVSGSAFFSQGDYALALRKFEEAIEGENPGGKITPALAAALKFGNTGQKPSQGVLYC